MEVWLCSFLTSKLDAGEWSTSGPGHYIPEEWVPSAHRTAACMDPRPKMDVLEMSKISHSMTFSVLKLFYVLQSQEFTYTTFLLGFKTEIQTGRSYLSDVQLYTGPGVNLNKWVGQQHDTWSWLYIIMHKVTIHWSILISSFNFLLSLSKLSLSKVFLHKILSTFLVTLTNFLLTFFLNHHRQNLITNTAYN